MGGLCKVSRASSTFGPIFLLMGAWALGVAAKMPPKAGWLLTSNARGVGNTADLGTKILGIMI